MDAETIKQLNTLNKRFYSTAAQDFSNSRSYYWHGWREFLPDLERLIAEKETLSVLDVGCGNGRFGKFLVDNLPSIPILYTGIDMSSELLQIAQQKLSTTHLDAKFQRIDIVEALLTDSFPTTSVYDVIVVFGVFHHIPSQELRIKLIKTLSKLLTPQGLLICTFWRFLDSADLTKKEVSHPIRSIDPSKLEKDDYIISWDREVHSIRYCHFTTPEEETQLVTASKLALLHDFESDGKEGKGNKYLVLQNNTGV